MNMLTTKEAAEQLGVTVTRVQQMINAGRLPAEKMGRDYVINADDMATIANRKPGRPPKKAEVNLTALKLRKRTTLMPAPRRATGKK